MTERQQRVRRKYDGKTAVRERVRVRVTSGRKKKKERESS